MGELLKRRDDVLKFLAETFGGATASATHRGAYRAISGDLVYEEGMSVTSFTTCEQWKKDSSKVFAEVRRYCVDWGQECMGLEINGVLEFVMPKDDMDGESLCKSLIRRMEICGK